MALSQVKISVNDLIAGMFVSRLDRPWSETPFPIQGILLKDIEDINRLRVYCRYVYIDTAKGVGPLEPPGVRTSLRASGEAAGRSVGGASPPSLRINRSIYSASIPLIQESPRAARIMTELRGQLLSFSKQLARGAAVDYDALRVCVSSMVDSVLRCPDAFTWLLRLQGKDLYLHDHSLRSALWGVQFARFMGLSKDQVQTLCLALLLKDMGKLRLPSTLLRGRRTPAEEQEYRKFVQYSVEMLRADGKIEADVVAVIEAHCERHDGTGFPRGLAGNKIPLLARIAAIATTYDTICNPRESVEPVAPSRAVSVLYNQRDQAFSEDLVVYFIQSIGLYPTGTFVELTTGNVAVVVEQDFHSRLTPKVVVIKDNSSAANSEQRECFIVDLRDEAVARERLIQHGVGEAGKVAKLAIARDLGAGSIDIDLSSLTPVFLIPKVQRPRKRGWLSFLDRW